MPRSSGTRDDQKAKPTGICAITVEGYKSIADECRLEIRPLTILAGANSSGKSSALQPLLLMKQTLEANYDAGALLLNGPSVRCTSVDQLLSRVSGKRRATRLRVGIEARPIGRVLVTYVKSGKSGRGGFRIGGMLHEHPKLNIRLTPGMTHAQIVRAMASGFGKESADGILSLFRSECPGQRLCVGRAGCFLYVGPPSDEVRPASLDDRNIHDMILSRILASVPPFCLDAFFAAYVRRIIHVSGSRGNPERTYRTAAVGTEFPGRFETYVASIVSEWKSTKPELFSAVGDDLHRMGLASGVDAVPVNDTEVELRVGRLPHRARRSRADTVSIADAGFGLSQVLPVLVALRAASREQLVYIEQPELHLHPRAQAVLVELLAAAARRGVRVVVETHSALVLLGVQTLVAEGALPVDLVKLHWFQRRRTGATHVRSADLDEAGAFGKWPEDFGDVELQAESRYLDAAERAREGK